MISATVGLHIQEAVATFGTGEHAGFEAAEDAVAVAGDEAIGSVAQGLGQELEEESEKLPNSAELLQHEDDGVGASEEMFVRLGFFS